VKKEVNVIYKHKTFAGNNYNSRLLQRLSVKKMQSYAGPMISFVLSLRRETVTVPYGLSRRKTKAMRKSFNVLFLQSKHRFLFSFSLIMPDTG
jgi:hypothetical protein